MAWTRAQVFLVDEGARPTRPSLSKTEPSGIVGLTFWIETDWMMSGAVAGMTK
jgi:hypothetical protein